MTLRELIFLLLGTAIGTGIAPLRRWFSSLDFSRKRELVVKPPVQEVEPDTLPPTPVPEPSAREELELEIPGVRVRITTRRLVAVVALLLIAVAVWMFVGRRVKPPVFAEPTPSGEESLRSDMQRGIEKPLYSVQPYPNEEVVNGYRGNYYYVDLKRADSRRTLLFRPKEYIKDEFSDDFRDSMQAFRADILRHVDDNKRRIFVRGSADKSGDDAVFLATLIEGESKQIRFLPTLPGDWNRYSPHEEAQEITREYANRHLPNLRAAYVQDKLRALGYDSKILQGSVTNQVSEKDRCAIMLLYVNWHENILEE